ncbi:hypothetical protein AB0M36_12600 [Actinoplanes sp. NPDC051346]|uniref:hypothetical protein n=1 Tax=Actinoplanes sp. NPDC051346 TaxID=3155048 RepID=UPI00341C3232
MIFIIASVAAAGVPWLMSIRSSPASADGPAVGDPAAAGAAPAEQFAVVCAAPPRIDDAYCARIGADIARRTRLTPEERETATRLAPAVDQAAEGSREHRAGCEPVAANVCRRLVAAPDVDDVRDALTAAGFPGVVVRTARADDPAPAGAVLYAVEAGAACLLGYLSQDSVGAGSARVGGRLPDGTCLAR